MSWKATSYVKELTKNLSHTEKLLLFVLADYHNTSKQIAWPAMEILAHESLMSERNARRILQRLEGKGIVARVVPKGGNQKTTLYSFPALDSGGQPVPQREDNREDKNSVREDKTPLSGGQIDTPNKEERVNGLTGKYCNRCGGMQILLNPGQRPHLLPCPECNPENQAQIHGVGV